MLGSHKTALFIGQFRFNSRPGEKCPFFVSFSIFVNSRLCDIIEKCFLTPHSAHSPTLHYKERASLPKILDTT